MSIDLTNQKNYDVSAELDAVQNDKLFSKTAPDEFLAISKKDSGVALPTEQQFEMVSKILDSETSSPTMKSDIALRTTS